MSRGKQYAHAPEVRAIAERLIELHHPHLAGVRIEYVWVDKPPVVGGQRKAAVMRKVSGLNAFLATRDFEGAPPPFFVMEVCAPVWRAKSAAWRVALVDHELKHGGRRAETIFVVPHDVEEFDDVAERHGRWNEGLESFAEALGRGEEGGGRPPAPPLKNNREQSNAVQKGAKRKSEWKAPEVARAH
jgi:hypothetical protein